MARSAPRPRGPSRRSEVPERRAALAYISMIAHPRCVIHDDRTTPCVRAVCFPAKLGSGWRTGLRALHCLPGSQHLAAFLLDTLAFVQDGVGVEIRPTSWRYANAPAPSRPLSRARPHAHPTMTSARRTTITVDTYLPEILSRTAHRHTVHTQPLRHASTQPQLASSTPARSWLRSRRSTSAYCRGAKTLRAGVWTVQPVRDEKETSYRTRQGSQYSTTKRSRAGDVLVRDARALVLGREYPRLLVRHPPANAFSSASEIKRERRCTHCSSSFTYSRNNPTDSPSMLELATICGRLTVAMPAHDQQRTKNA